MPIKIIKINNPNVDVKLLNIIYKYSLKLYMWVVVLNIMKAVNNHIN